MLSHFAMTPPHYHDNELGDYVVPLLMCLAVRLMQCDVHSQHLYVHLSPLLQDLEPHCVLDHCLNDLHYVPPRVQNLLLYQLYLT
jgi:hypothetical protein